MLQLQGRIYKVNIIRCDVTSATIQSLRAFPGFQIPHISIWLSLLEQVQSKRAPFTPGNQKVPDHIHLHLVLHKILTKHLHLSLPHGDPRFPPWECDFSHQGKTLHNSSEIVQRGLLSAFGGRRDSRAVPLVGGIKTHLHLHLVECGPNTFRCGLADSNPFSKHSTCIYRCTSCHQERFDRQPITHFPCVKETSHLSPEDNSKDGWQWLS